jgi:predicted nucleic acid-binding protein
MAENKVSVEISLEEKAALAALTKLSREINKTEDSFKKMGDEGDSAFGVVGDAAKGVSDGFGTLVKGVTVANLASDAIIGTANAMKQFVVDSFNAALEAEESINKLSQALRASGSFSQSAVEDFQAYAQALAETTRFSDDEVIAQLALAKSFGATNEQAKKLVSAATELAATYGGTLEQRVEQLGKTLTGTGGKLDSLVPGFKALTEEQLKAGAAFDHITNKLGGSAASQLNSTGGQIGQLTKAFGEVKEAFGAFALSLVDTSIFKYATDGVNSLVQSLNDLVIENQRSDKGFVENQDSINQLSREYESLTAKIEDAQAVIRKREEGGFFESLFANAERAKEQLQQLIPLQKKLYDQINNASIPVEAQIAAPPSRVPAKSEDEVLKEQEAFAKILQARQEGYAQLEIAQAEYNARQVEQAVLGQQITEENYAFELQRLQEAEAMKIEAIYAAEESKAKAIQDSKTRQYALQKVAIDKEAALEKSNLDTKKKVDQAHLALEQQKQAHLIGIMGATFNLATALAKDGSKEQFLIQKAAALAEIAVADGKARALIPAQVAHLLFPANLAAAATLNAYVTAQTALGAAAVVASAIKGYEQGGVVPGNSYSGDNVMARVNSAEVIMNRQQQANTLMAIANGTGGGDSKIDRLIAAVMSQPINLVVDGRVLATVIRKEVQGGFRLA